MALLARFVVAVVAFALVTVPSLAAAQEITLKVVSAFPENTLYVKRLESWIERANQDGRGTLRLNFIGGPKAIPTFEVGNAVRTGVVDIAMSTGAFYTNVFPESDALKLTQIPIGEQRKNGAYEYINKLWNERLNAVYLGRAIDGMPFHLFLKKPITKPDLTGLRVRGLPIYREFFQALNAQAVVTTPPGEVYTALERGVVDGYGWPVTGLFDLGLQEQTKYRVEPGFYNVEISVLVNLDTWRKKLDDRQRAFLIKTAMWMEDLNLGNAKAWEEEKKRQAAAGIQPITFSGKEREEYLAKANSTIWASIIKRSPEHGPKLRALLTK